MIQPDHLSQHTPSLPSALPAEWVDELRGLDPRSYEYREMTTAIGALAAEEGIEFDTSVLRQPEVHAIVPEGFLSAEVLVGYQAELPRNQFSGIIPSLANREGSIFTDVTEYVTDAHSTVRVCDLRSEMPSQVIKNGPTDPREIKILDDKVSRDLKQYADTGQARCTITGISKVNYTKVNGTKIREYWMPVEDENNANGIRTVARLADTKDSTSSQSTLYRALLGVKYHA